MGKVDYETIIPSIDRDYTTIVDPFPRLKQLGEYSPTENKRDNPLEDKYSIDKGPKKYRNDEY